MSHLLKNILIRGKERLKLFLAYLMNKIKYFFVYYIYIFFEVFLYYKYKVGFNGKFRDLNRFKNIHKGERCYVVCNGPSLIKEDLQKLEGKHTFFVNHVILNNWVDWDPEYYCIIDDGRWPGNEVIMNLRSKAIFMAWYIYDKVKLKEKQYVSIPWLDIYIGRRYKKRINYRFSEDITKVVYEGFTVCYAVLQIAVYMGFSEIVLIGCDNKNTASETNAITIDGVDEKLSDEVYEGIYEKMRGAYRTAENYSKAHGFRIYNATRGGCLEEFERRDLDELLQDGK